LAWNQATVASGAMDAREIDARLELFRLLRDEGAIIGGKYLLAES